MNSTPLVSVVIPVYNTSFYLRRCLDSVIQQTYFNLEIIIVNDGSTDDSLSIIKEYAERDKRIVYIDKPNEGLPLTRKAGVERATGKYIQHLDSDDALAHGAIRMLVDRAEETGADIVAIPFYYVYEDGTKSEADMLRFDELSPIEYFQSIVRWRCHGNVWANFQRRSLFCLYPIEFVPNISYGEDLLLMTQLLSFANKVVMCDVPLVYYYQRSSSMCNANWSINCPDKREYTRWIEAYLEKNGWASKIPEEMALMRVHAIFYCMIARDKDFSREDVKKMWIDFERYPTIKRKLPCRWRKLARAFKKSYNWGMCYLLYYKWRKKLPA